MLLEGKKGLVLNVTNKNSIGWAIADAANAHGATVGVGAQNDKLLGRVQEMIDGRERFDTFTVDFGFDDQLEALRDAVAAAYGTIDFLVHSAAFAKKEDLQGRFIDTSRDGFSVAMDVSAYSLIALCRALEPVLADDASVMTMSYLGSVRAVLGYNVMGVAKAALESAVRYLAIDLGERGIRVNTVSPGPINTVSARGVKGLIEKIDHVHERAPLKRPFAQEEVAGTCVYLMSDLSKGVSGQVVYVDDGYNVVGI
ncbi:MAG: enoyl-ACP reductase [Armatimonadetes bacterium]|nr:enoyl-ACP reductase [Armatimonadota bacterium]